jgi:dihydrodipicolinate synthase/N-acetylneuraminate lyase
MHDYVDYVAGKVDIPIVAFNTPHSGMTMTHETMARIVKIPNVCGFKNAIKDPWHTIRAMEMFGAEIVLSYPFEEQLLEIPGIGCGELHQWRRGVLGWEAIHLRDVIPM